MIRLLTTLSLMLAVLIGSTGVSYADEHENFVSEITAQRFIGIWKVKRRGGSLLSLAGERERAIWSIRRKNKKLIIDIPEADVVFDNIKVDNTRLSQKIITRDPKGTSNVETSIDIEVVEGLFDGEFIHNDATITVQGRFEDLYRSTMKAEKVFLDKLEKAEKVFLDKLEKAEKDFDNKLKAEKKRLGEDVRYYNKNAARYKKETADLKLKLKGMGSKKAWNKEKQNCPGSFKPIWNNCIGTRTFFSGSKYVGYWKSGKQHGQGVLTHADGEKYEGSFKNGLHHGKGTITYPSGKVMKGIWENDKFKSERK